MKVEKFHKEAVEKIKKHADPVTGFWEDTELGKLFGEVFGAFERLQASLYLEGGQEQTYEEVGNIQKQLQEVESRLDQEMDAKGY